MVCHLGATARYGCHLPGTTPYSLAQCSPMAKDPPCACSWHACEQRWLGKAWLDFQGSSSKQSHFEVWLWLSMDY